MALILRKTVFVYADIWEAKNVKPNYYEWIDLFQDTTD